MDDFGADLARLEAILRVSGIYKRPAMDERQLEAQSRLLIELGEPETWLETMLRASRRSALHAEGIGDVGLSRRWQTLTRGLQYAIAATVHDPLTETNQSGAQCSVYQGERQEPTQAILNAALEAAQDKPTQPQAQT